MQIYISLLRGINLGSHNKLSMPELVRLYASLACANIRTYLQSGNLIFESDEPDPQNLAARLQAGIHAGFGYEVGVLLRSPASFQRLLENNPFTHGRSEDPSKLHVTFLHHAPSVDEWGKLGPTFRNGDEFSPDEQEIFLFRPNGYGRTKFSNSFFERKLGQPATTRNWKTVNALYEMVKTT